MIDESEQARWDEQIDEDSASGKLDFLFEDAVSLLPTWHGFPPS
jgi:hypothetical protein